MKREHKYTGVGARCTPTEINVLMSQMAHTLEGKGMMLRTGGAAGADQAFLDGLSSPAYNAEVYLPYQGFQGYHSRFPEPTEAAYEMAKKYHPVWKLLKRPIQAFHARNMHLVLGQELDEPSKFLICWTRGGKITGGTGTAIQCALDHSIPVLNLASTSVSICSEVVSNIMEW